jgi:hypothetical protein
VDGEQARLDVLSLDRLGDPCPWRGGELMSMAKLRSPLVAGKSPRPSGDAQRVRAAILLPFARASFMRNDSPLVTTTTL